MLPATNALKGKAPALTVVSRGLRLRRLVIDLAFTKPQPLRPLWKRHQILLCLSQESSLPEDEDRLGGESTQEGDEGLFISSFLEEALGGDGNLQIKMARTMQAQEKHDRECFICQSPDHLMRDHYQGKNGKGPLQPKGPPQNKLAREMATASPPGQAVSHGAPPK